MVELKLSALVYTIISSASLVHMHPIQGGARSAGRAVWRPNDEGSGKRELTAPQTSVSCPGLAGIHTWPHVPGLWMPAFRGNDTKLRAAF